MALTLRGNRIGMAAHTEAVQYRRNLEHRKAEIAKRDFNEALARLAEADPEGWEAWYDDDGNVPETLHWGDRAEIDGIIERINKRIQAAPA